MSEPGAVHCDCGQPAEFVGSVGVSIHGGGDAQADRWDSACGNTLLVVRTERIDGEDDRCPVCGARVAVCHSISADPAAWGYDPSWWDLLHGDDE